MYSAQLFVDGIYGYDDLPDQFTASYIDEGACVRGTYVKANGQIIPLGGEVLPWINNEYYYLGPISQIQTTEGIVQYQTFVGILPGSEEEAAVWFAYAWKISGPNLIGYSSGFPLTECLFPDFFPNDCDPADEFANTYTINGGPLGPIIVTRQSLCEWTGLDSCGELASLFFEDDGLFFGWNVIVPDYFGEGECNRLDAQEGQKEGFQNTPTGLYTNNLSVS